MRPRHWIEFRDIALEPSRQVRESRGARRLKATAFGEVREIQFTDLFDFDTGKLGDFPRAHDGSQSFDGVERNPSWIRQHGFDAEARAGQLNLFAVAIVDVPNAEWNTLTPAALEERFSHSFYGPPRLPSAPGATLPVTYGFRTQDGATGLLQLMALDSRQPGATLRYRLIERAHFE